MLSQRFQKGSQIFQRISKRFQNGSQIFQNYKFCKIILNDFRRFNQIFNDLQKFHKDLNDFAQISNTSHSFKKKFQIDFIRFKNILIILQIFQ